MEKKRTTKKKKPEATRHQDQGFLRDIRQLIDGLTVRISKPKRFFARKWKAMLPLISDQVQEKETNNTFALQPKLFLKFRESLRLLLKLKKQFREEYADYTPSDLVAEALCLCAEDVSSPVGVHAVPIGRGIPFQEVIEYPAKEAQLPSAKGAGSQDRKIRIAIESVHRESDNLPELAISIAGKPIRALIAFNLMADDSPEKAAAQKEAKRVWDTVIKRVSVRLRIGRPYRGKPAGDVGYYAAWEHDHAGWSWARIAKAECMKQHEHTESCARNYRKLVEQFYLRQEKEYREAGHGVTAPAEKRGSAHLSSYGIA